jgi:steroid 5-alpha reductase family enzyme
MVRLPLFVCTMSPELASILIRCAIAIAALMTVVWLLSVVRKDASIVDIAWGAGFVVVAWTAYLFAGTSGSIVLPILVSVWGIRLSAYLFRRNHGKPEDYRYQAMRQRWGTAFPIVSLVTVFVLQGVVMWVVSLPVQVGTALLDQTHPWLTVAGVALWGIGLFFESVGDWQLARFKANQTNAGRVLDAGLWRFTRHPNYFGDLLVWWGLYAVAMSKSDAGWTIIGPIVMSVFLMRVSGVTLLEKKLTNTKPEYVNYVARTNAFFPGPRRDS